MGAGGDSSRACRRPCRDPWGVAGEGGQEQVRAGEGSKEGGGEEGQVRGRRCEESSKGEMEYSQEEGK